MFCSIVSGELPSYKIYEDDTVISILDIRPVSRGHTLVIPKKHYENIHEIPEDVMLRVYKIVKRVAEAQMRSLSPTGISVTQNNGAAAGQIIFHFHTHVVPKDAEFHERVDAGPAELSRIATAIRDNMRP